MSGCSSRQSHHFLQAAHQPVQPGFQNPACLGQHQGGLPVFGVVADKQCPCLASRPTRERYPPTPPFWQRGTRLKHRGRSHKPFEAGVIPAPATICGTWLSLQSARPGTGRPQVRILPFRPFYHAAVAEIERHSSSKRTHASASLAGSANQPLPGGVKVAQRPVKPPVLVRVQAWQPFPRVAEAD